jgi:hypothetical protein
MKKIYKNPDYIIMHLQSLQMISASNGVTSNNGIGYGGVDDDGSLDPDTKEFKSTFDWEEW